MRFKSKSLCTMFSCWVFRADMAFPDVSYRDRVWSEQLIKSVFECPEVLGWKLLQTLKKCLIIRAPCPERSLDSQEFTHLRRGSGQNVWRSCSSRGCTVLGLHPWKTLEKCVQTALWVTQTMLLRGKQTSEGAQGTSRSHHHPGISIHEHSAPDFHSAHTKLELLTVNKKETFYHSQLTNK